MADSKAYTLSQGGQFLHALQPVLGSSNGLSTEKNDQVLQLLEVDGIPRCTQENLLDYYHILGKEYDKYLSNINGMNLSTVFANNNSMFFERYIDWIHMTPSANKLISEKLLNHIFSKTSLGSIWAWFDFVVLMESF